MYEPEDRSRPLSRFLVPLGALIVAGAIVAGAAYAMGAFNGDEAPEPEPVVEVSPTVAPTATPPGATPAELAIGEYVRSTLGAAYAGDCSVAAVQQAPGAPGAGTPAATGAQGQAQTGESLCSQSRGDRDNVQAYVLGRPLAQPNYWVFVQQDGGAFRVIHAPEITPESEAVPGIPWPLRPGAEVVVAGAAPCLNVREGPSLEQAAVDCIPDGTTIVLAAGPTDADGYQWWQVDGRAGWVAAEYLRFADD